MKTRERTELIASCAVLFEKWTGGFNEFDLLALIGRDLGNALALDGVELKHGLVSSYALAPARLLHVVSENTPHAAFQSLLRGLTLGSRNHLKLPSAGLPEFEDAAAQLPPALAELVSLSSELPADWQTRFDAVVVFGSDDTIAWFRAHTPPHSRLVTHGTKLSIALVADALGNASSLAAKDVSLFDQRGCLSIHDVYVARDAGISARDFAAQLAAEMEQFNKLEPRSPLQPSAAGAITNLRETARFVAASRPAEVALWESVDNTDWTVIYESDPILKISPMNRVVYVKPWPEQEPREALGANLRHLSTLALHPFDQKDAAAYLQLGATRICPLGNTQQPPLSWHQDGLPPLGSLVTWVDIES